MTYEKDKVHFIQTIMRMMMIFFGHFNKIQMWIYNGSTTTRHKRNSHQSKWLGAQLKKKKKWQNRFYLLKVHEENYKQSFQRSKKKYF